MSKHNINDSMVDMFLFESSQQIEQLEHAILTNEDKNAYTEISINEIFRIMHTIKGSAAMMMFHGISDLAHTIEDLFYYLREEKPKQINYDLLSDLILESIDFIKVELMKINNSDNADGDATNIIEEIKHFLSKLKANNTNNPLIEDNIVNLGNNRFFINECQTVQSTYSNTYKAVIFFEDGCEMENIRAYTIIHKLKEITDCYAFYPRDILDNDKNIGVIRKEGFQIYLKANSTLEDIRAFFNQTIYLKDIELIQLEEDIFSNNLSSIDLSSNENLSGKNTPNNNSDSTSNSKENTERETHKIKQDISTKQSIISVSVEKLDKLMNLVGEMVIAEAMVTQNSDLNGLELNNFQKAASHLNKITSEIQDTVMAVRMVPLSTTFLKMNRIVRDISKKLHKEVQLEIEGEETEVDKNIIEQISDPLMHLVRNALDHGIEMPDIRQEMGKPRKGTITLKAKNQGNDVLIIIKDDGRGLYKEDILKKASDYNLLNNEIDMTDTEIFNLILLPGFSTKENITEYSGRGVGMDVVTKNIGTIGGSITIDSMPDRGTTFILKIPLTLAIIDGMNIKVGSSCYTLPMLSIKESFRPKIEDIIIDPDGNELIMVRGLCYPILRLHKLFKVDTSINNFVDGIIIMIEQDDEIICVFADELLGQQQVVVKALPKYIAMLKKIKGVAGCTLLGDGKISLIIDIAGLINNI